MWKQLQWNVVTWLNRMWERLQWNIVTWWRLGLWKIAVRGYKPGWCLGNRFQRWWAARHDELLGWLTWQLLRDLKDAEREQADAEATDDD